LIDWHYILDLRPVLSDEQAAKYQATWPKIPAGERAKAQHERRLQMLKDLNALNPGKNYFSGLTIFLRQAPTTLPVLGKSQNDPRRNSSSNSNG